MASASAALLLAFGLPPLLEDVQRHDAWLAAPELDLAALAETDLDETDLDETDDAEPIDLDLPGHLELKAGPDGVPIVTSLQEVLDTAPDTMLPGHATWVRHRIRPRERITQIAARYGVTPQDVVDWNHLDSRDKFPKGYWRIRVRAHRIPPPRIAVHYLAQADESWGDIAAKFHVEQPDLRAWNWQRRKLEEGRELTVWVDPGEPQTIHPDEGPPVPDTFDIPVGGQSVGYPQRGKLVDGVLLPDSELYTRREPTHGLWGSTHTIETLTRAFAAFRHDTGYEGEVVIGAISRKHGRRFHPHKSHQSGRDVDIRLPRLPGIPKDAAEEPNPDEVDWRATWGLIRALADTGEVSRIFLIADLHRRLYEAGRQMGETDEEIREILAWPNWEHSGDPLVRHSKGHDGHIHVRFHCGPDEPRCKAHRKRK